MQQVAEQQFGVVKRMPNNECIVQKENTRLRKENEELKKEIEALKNKIIELMQNFGKDKDEDYQE